MGPKSSKQSDYSASEQKILKLLCVERRYEQIPLNADFVQGSRLIMQKHKPTTIACLDRLCTTSEDHITILKAIASCHESMQCSEEWLIMEFPVRYSNTHQDIVWLDVCAAYGRYVNAWVVMREEMGEKWGKRPPISDWKGYSTICEWSNMVHLLRLGCDVMMMMETAQATGLQLMMVTHKRVLRLLIVDLGTLIDMIEDTWALFPLLLRLEEIAQKVVNGLVVSHRAHTIIHTIVEFRTDQIGLNGHNPFRKDRTLEWQQKDETARAYLDWRSQSSPQYMSWPVSLSDQVMFARQWQRSCQADRETSSPWHESTRLEFKPFPTHSLEVPSESSSNSSSDEPPPKIRKSDATKSTKIMQRKPREEQHAISSSSSSSNSLNS